MSEELTTFGDRKRKLVAAHVLIIGSLPAVWQGQSAAHFNDSIFELMQAKFDLGRETIDRIIRFPWVDDEQQDQEFGVKCLVSFCSREHKDRVISGKSSLEPPTTVDPVTEPPNELSGEAEFEAATPDDVGMAGAVVAAAAVEESAGTQKGATGAAADSGPNESSGTSGPSKDSIDDATLEQVVKRGIMTEYVDKRRRREKPDEVIIRELMQSIKDTVAARTDHGAGKRAFMDNYYQNLAIDWHGSPELQWRGQCWQRKCSLSLIFIWQ
ncbi:unnamed protein product [Gongylonema pulchrum]|uniref:DEK_C domain-containing protein n=1 Tax=Gongylonema pulchrum TaxID=637853 RepID=A0A183E2W6_9BILA|nr:unnamed protein product [Gongylonema pulchrum]